jgi:hypothetical protein
MKISLRCRISAFRFVAVAATLFLSSPAFGQGDDRPDITRVEEDWVAQIIEPDASIAAPQFTSVMTPDQSDPSTYFTVEFNHSTAGEFQPGGLQLQSWGNDQFIEATPRLIEDPLEQNDENLLWTQYMQVSDGQIRFGLKSMTSKTWREADVTEAVLSSGESVSHLNNYRIVDSSNGSGVGFADNRVGDMVLLEVRLYSGSVLVERHVLNRYIKRRGGQILEGSGN